LPLLWSQEYFMCARWNGWVLNEFWWLSTRNSFFYLLGHPHLSLDEVRHSLIPCTVSSPWAMFVLKIQLVHILFIILSLFFIHTSLVRCHLTDERITPFFHLIPYILEEEVQFIFRTFLCCVWHVGIGHHVYHSLC
jgi:hypothetical protein